jgi:tetratricopeptide (TPR) repeat protein
LFLGVAVTSSLLFSLCFGSNAHEKSYLDFAEKYISFSQYFSRVPLFESTALQEIANHPPRNELVRLSLNDLDTGSVRKDLHYFFTRSLLLYLLGDTAAADKSITRAEKAAKGNEEWLWCMARIAKQIGWVEGEFLLYDSVLSKDTCRWRISNEKMSSILHHDGVDARTKGFRQKASHYFRYAEEFFPGTAGTSLTGIDLTEVVRTPQVIWPVLKNLMRSLTGVEYHHRLVLTIYILGVLGIFIFAFAFLFVLFLKVSPHIFHQAGRLFPENYCHPIAIKIIVTTIVGIITILGMKYNILLILPVLLLVFFSSRYDRRIVFFICAVLLLIPLTTPVGITIIESFDRDSPLSILRDSGKYYCDEEYRHFCEDHPDLSSYKSLLFRMGLMYSHQKMSDKAKEVYCRILLTDGNDWRARNNLGNTYYMEQDYRKAEENYTAALRINPRSPVVHYNLGQVHIKNLKYHLADKEMKRAQELDSQFIKRNYSHKEGEDVVFAAAGYMDILKDLIDNRTFVPSRAGHTGWSPWGPEGYHWSMLLSMVVLFVLFFISERSPLHHYTCKCCGAAICNICLKFYQRHRICTGCHHKINSIISPALQGLYFRTILKRMLKRKRIIRIVTSLLVPGGGHILEDYPVKGAVILFVTMLIVIVLVSPPIFWRVTGTGGYTPHIPLGKCVFGILLLSAYGFAQFDFRRILRKKEKMSGKGMWKYVAQ